jgi:hypothetical protein
MGPLYFDIRSPVFVMRTCIVCILNLSTLSEVRISNFEYVYRVMHSEKLVHKSKVRIWRCKSRFNYIGNLTYLDPFTINASFHDFHVFTPIIISSVPLNGTGRIWHQIKNVLSARKQRTSKIENVAPRPLNSGKTRIKQHSVSLSLHSCLRFFSLNTLKILFLSL